MSSPSNQNRHLHSSHSLGSREVQAESARKVSRERAYERADNTSEGSASTIKGSVPRMPTSYSMPSGGVLPHERDKSSTATHYAPSARSPSNSSLSSHRSHPYPRRPSYSLVSPQDRDPRDLPRIQLPSLNSASSYFSEPPIPPLSSISSQGPTRPHLHHSDSSGSSGRDRVHLPPLHSISDSRVSPPAAHHSRPHSPVPTSRPVARSPSPVARHHSPYGLRPSYYETTKIAQPHVPVDDRYRRPAYPTHAPSHHPHQPYYAPEYAYHDYPPPHSSRHHSPHGYRDPSPPLRQLPPDYHSSRPPPHVAYYVPPGYHDPSARSRSHSSTSARPRREEPIEQPGPGQNRRLAHLMSEQKRRESINTGFTALRNALPNSIPTDSKAIILRKAVTHITHLEGLLRKAGVNPGTSGGPVLTPSSWDEDGEAGDGADGEEREDEENGDVEMDNGKWEEDGDMDQKYRRSSSNSRRKSRQ